MNNETFWLLCLFVVVVLVGFVAQNYMLIAIGLGGFLGNWFGHAILRIYVWWRSK